MRRNVQRERKKKDGTGSLISQANVPTKGRFCLVSSLVHREEERRRGLRKKRSNEGGKREGNCSHNPCGVEKVRKMFIKKEKGKGGSRDREFYKKGMPPAWISLFTETPSAGYAKGCRIVGKFWEEAISFLSFSRLWATSVSAGKKGGRLTSSAGEGVLT